MKVTDFLQFRVRPSPTWTPMSAASGKRPALSHSVTSRVTGRFTSQQEAPAVCQLDLFVKFTKVLMSSIISSMYNTYVVFRLFCISSKISSISLVVPLQLLSELRSITASRIVGRPKRQKRNTCQPWVHPEQIEHHLFDGAALFLVFCFVFFFLRGAFPKHFPKQFLWMKWQSFCSQYRWDNPGRGQEKHPRAKCPFFASMTPWMTPWVIPSALNCWMTPWVAPCLQWSSIVIPDDSLESYFSPRLLAACRICLWVKPSPGAQQQSLVKCDDLTHGQAHSG